MPGGLAQLGPLSRRTSATDLLTAGAGGTALAARVRLGALADCAAVAEAAGGAAVVAGPVSRRGAVEVRAATRDAGAAFGAPARLGAAGRTIPPVAAVVAASGHAVVGWAQSRGNFESPLSRSHEVRIVAARRAPGGRFGPVEPLTPWRRMSGFATPRISAGIDATGTATLAWLRPRPDTRRISGIADLEAAAAEPSRPFAVRRLPARTQDAPALALAVAADGRALLAVDGVAGLTVFERPPAGERFARVPLAPASSRFAHEYSAPVVALRADGGALVAWRVGFNEDTAGVFATTRTAAGPFGPVRRVAPPGRGGSFGDSAVVLAGEGPYAPDDPGNNRLRAALPPDGRALLAWTTGSQHEPRAAAGTLAGGIGRPVALGSPVRDANGLAPLFLADGRAALAWTDNQAWPYPRGHGRLHLAVAGVPAAEPPPVPRLTLHGDRTQRLFAAQPLRVAAACDRACDVRVALGGRQADAAGVTRSAAGRTRLRLALEDRRGSRSVRVVARATAPGGRRVARAALRIRVLRRPPLPIPRLVAVRARRRGAAIVVSWRTAFPARRAGYVVVGSRTRRLRRDSVFDRGGYAVRRGRGRTRFAVRLRPRRPGAVRWVHVRGFSYDGDAMRRALVRVR